MTAPDARQEARELAPVAWLHTLHQEFDQRIERVTQSPTSPFGVPGRDYSEEYPVTSEPLFLERAILAAEQRGAERMRERAAMLIETAAFRTDPENPPHEIWSHGFETAREVFAAAIRAHLADDSGCSHQHSQETNDGYQAKPKRRQSDRSIQ